MSPDGVRWATRWPRIVAVVDRLGDDTVPALVWLTAGLTATTGDGDPEWLSQFDPDTP